MPGLGPSPTSARGTITKVEDVESTILVAPIVEVEEEVSQVDLKALVSLNPSGSTCFCYTFTTFGELLDRCTKLQTSQNTKPKILPQVFPKTFVLD